MPLFKTPLRYPGGKQKLTPFVEEILKVNNIVNGHYVEPYAGGAGVGLELLLTKKVNAIHLNDSDLGIFAFWHSILNSPDRFCEMISRASLTIEEWKKRREIVKNPKSQDLFELGFSVFYLNRCNRSGVLSAGVIGGLNQDGNYKMNARFNRDELIRRVEVISLYRDKIFISNSNAEDFILNYIPNLPDNTLVYLDPPYFVKGSDLYLNSYQKEDHIRISHVIQNQIDKPWILSYDGAPPIIDLYKERRYFLYDLQYSVGRSYKGKEIFIFDDKINLPDNCKLKNIEIGLANLVESYN